MVDIESLQKWHRDAELYGWELPPIAPRWRRVWGVRHVRAAVLAYRIDSHYSTGLGQFGIRSGYDEWVLWAVRVGIA